MRLYGFPFSKFDKRVAAAFVVLSGLRCEYTNRLFSGSCEEYIALLECKIVKSRGIVQKAPSSDQNRERSIEHCSKAES